MRGLSSEPWSSRPRKTHSRPFQRRAMLWYMPELGSRRRNLPAPPHVVFEDLTTPNRSEARPWLSLLDDEVAPQILESREPEHVVWSSLWPRRADARITFELPQAGPGGGTDLRWTLTVDEPAPDDSLTGHMRKRINTLIHANLRYTYGQ